MTANPNPNDLPAVLEQLQQAEPDLLRSMLTAFVQALMSADADAACGAEFGTRSPDRTNRRNGYRPREWDTRAGTIELAIPKLREGSYFPDWLLERRKRAERALISVVATSYLLGVSTRRMEKLVETARHHPAVEVPGRDDGQGPRRPGGGVPDPAVGRRPVHVRRRGRVDDEGPRGRPGGQRRLPGRDRGERRRAPRDPRPGCVLGRVPRRLADVLPRPDRPRPVRGQPGDLRRPSRAGRRRRARPCPAPAGNGAAPTMRRT